MNINGSECHSRKRSGVATVLAALWVGVLGYGFVRLLNHDNRPGTAIDAPPRRIPDVDPHPRISLPSEFQLLVFVHPMCPCTRATLANLDLLLARTGDRMAIQLIVFEPRDQDSGWDPSREIATALASDRVTAIRDPGGARASQYKAVTSGSTVLYDAAGIRRFQGGITDSRGHVGESTGVNSIAEIVNSGESAVTSTPVFGCQILKSPAPSQVPADRAADPPAACPDHETPQSAAAIPSKERAR